MKRKISWEKDETSDSEGEESEEEPIIQSVLDDLSEAVSQERASDLLHSMAASKSILFWTPGGELLQNQRRIPGTNIAELIEYILLPQNEDIPEPKGLDSFLDGLAELGIDKRGIENELALDQLIQKEGEITEESSSDEEKSKQEEEEEEEEDDDDEEEEDEEENEQAGEGEEERDEETDEDENCDQCGDSDVKVNRIIGCPKCDWHDASFQHQKQFNEPISCSMCNATFPLNSETLKSKFVTCNKCDSLRYIEKE